MITNNFPNEIVNWMANITSVYPSYYAVGDGTTAETLGDTTLVNELYRSSFTLSSEDVIAKFQIVIPSTASTLYTKTIRESGTFDLVAAGTLFDRSVSPTGISFDAATNLRITKFTGLDNTPLTSTSLFMDDGLFEILLYLQGTGDEPSYIAWSSDLILEQCDAIGVGPNDWTDDGSAASTPTLNTTNYREGIKSINLGKDGAGSAIFSYKKDLAASENCSSVTTFYLELNIENAIDLAKFKTLSCLQVRIGSSSANYKYFDFDKADLIVGWQTLEIIVSGMSDNGAPVMSAIDYLGLFMETTNATDTITHGNLIMDYWRGYWLLNASNTILHDEQLRKAVSTPAKSSYLVSYTSIALAAEGNTYNYKFSGLLNAVAAGDLFLGIESFDESKNSTTQITTTIEITVGIYG